MTRTTTAAFEEFQRRISPSPVQQLVISARLNNARRLLADTFPAGGQLGLERAELIGSASRGTLVRPVTDIDVLAVFLNRREIFERYRADSSAFLQRVRGSIRLRTSVAQIGARGQAVRLFYKDGVFLDIAPVFSWSTGGYALPSGDGTWITTDPVAQAVWFERRKAELGRSLVSLVRLARRWNDVHSHRLSPFHVEVMVASMFSTMG